MRALTFAAAFMIALPAAAEVPTGTVGRDTCAACHEEVAAAFAAGPHGARMAARDAALLDTSCEACHGPGEAHANEPSTVNILGGRATPDAQSAGCLSCHAAQGAGVRMRTPAHAAAKVACLECHASGHAAPAAEPLLARARLETCTPCHASQTAQFALPSAHREGARRVECMSCHGVHGDTTANGRTEAFSVSPCERCHVEKAGPFVFPHPPMSVDGCTTCHRPHGSPNPKLLTRSDVTQLCLECHSDTPRFHNLSVPKYRNCQTCHAAIHGSQRDPNLFQE
jgi:DmsE family decaheme c-type cytochrome